MNVRKQFLFECSVEALPPLNELAFAESASLFDMSDNDLRYPLDALTRYPVSETVRITSNDLSVFEQSQINVRLKENQSRASYMPTELADKDAFSLVLHRRNSQDIVDVLSAKSRLSDYLEDYDTKMSLFGSVDN